jgi:hypothetical protein
LLDELLPGQQSVQQQNDVFVAANACNNTDIDVSINFRNKRYEGTKQKSTHLKHNSVAFSLSREFFDLLLVLFESFGLLLPRFVLGRVFPALLGELGGL